MLSFIRIAFLRRWSFAFWSSLALWPLLVFWLPSTCCVAVASGARQPAQPQPPIPAPVILVLGDSLSAGYGLPNGRSWVDLLQQQLAREKLDYRVVNASISGDTTLGGRNRLPAALAQHRPRIVVLELGANDGLRGQPVAAIRDNLKAMVHASRAAGARPLIVGMRIPPNYGQQYAGKFQDVFAEVARSEKVPLVPFLLQGFADKRDLFQQDGIHPTEQAQALILDTVWKALRPMLGETRKRAA